MSYDIAKEKVTATTTVARPRQFLEDDDVAGAQRARR